MTNNEIHASLTKINQTFEELKAAGATRDQLNDYIATAHENVGNIRALSRLARHYRDLLGIEWKGY